MDEPNPAETVTPRPNKQGVYYSASPILDDWIWTDESNEAVAAGVTAISKAAAELVLNNIRETAEASIDCLEGEPKVIFTLMEHDVELSIELDRLISAFIDGYTYPDGQIRGDDEVIHEARLMLEVLQSAQRRLAEAMREVDAGMER